MNRRAELLRLIRADPWRSAASYAEAFGAGMTPHDAGAMLARMAKDGLIRQSNALPGDRTDADLKRPVYSYGPTGREPAITPPERLGSTGASTSP